jgi:hypothetical protein
VSADRFDTEAWLDAESWLDIMAKLLALPVTEAFRQGVLVNLKVIAEHAAILEGFVPDDHLDPAPVFLP